MVKKPISSDQVEKIRWLFTDCDGVLTNGRVLYGPSGEQMREFHVRDGMGVELLRKKREIHTGIISGENSDCIRARAQKLDIDEVHLGIKDKWAVLEEFIQRRDYRLDQIAYIGDDINDLSVMRKVGFSACPSDAMETIRNVSHYVCSTSGGNGVLREVAQLLLGQP